MKFYIIRVKCDFNKSILIFFQHCAKLLQLSRRQNYLRLAGLALALVLLKSHINKAVKGNIAFCESVNIQAEISRGHNGGYLRERGSEKTGFLLNLEYFLFSVNSDNLVQSDFSVFQAAVHGQAQLLKLFKIVAEAVGYLSFCVILKRIELLGRVFILHFV